MKHVALIIAGVLLLAACACAGTVDLRLGSDGEIMGWLVVGPFPNPGTEKMTCRGMNADYLSARGTEPGAAPIEGQTVPSTASIPAWRLALADKGNGLEFTRLFNTESPGVVYAYAAVVSESDIEARLLLGSDDGVKVWVNGDLVHTSHLTRGTKRDEESVGIKLKAGTNRLLFKVDQHFGGWGLIARITDNDGDVLTGITERLDILPSSPEMSLVRAMMDKPGSLDLDALGRYQKWKRKTDIWMPWFRTNDRRPEPYAKVVAQIAEKIDDARSVGPDDLSKALGEMASFLEYQYESEWEALKRRMENPEPLMQVNPAKQDFVQVAPGGRYFVHSDGKFFIPLGYNHNPDWPKTGEAAPGSPNYDPAVTERFFKFLNESGVNVLRLMIEAPLGDHFIEKPIGKFSPQMVAWIDNMVTFAVKYDVKLMITPWDTFWMSNRWDINPYNIKNGGPVEKRIDFITKREVIEAQKKRWKFIIDRWGNTGAVFAWELLNECDLWWEASPKQLAAWANEMGDYVRTYEKQKWGRNHLTTISIANALPKDGLAEIAFRQQGVDIANNHLYIGAANGPDEPIGPALAIREGVNHALSNIRDNRPYIDTEDGPINRWISDQKLDNQVFHNMVWAHLSSGGAGSGFRWPYRHPHHLSDGMYAHLARMSKFARDVPWARLTGDLSDTKVTVPEGWIECSFGTKQGVMVWVTSAKPTAGTIAISWPDGPGTSKYRCYDTNTGEWFARGTARFVDGTMSIPVDGKRASVAVVVE